MILKVQTNEYLCNQKGIALRIINLPDGSLFIEADSFRFYLTEFIDGKLVEPTAENEYRLGRLVKQLHAYMDYEYPAGLNMAIE